MSNTNKDVLRWWNHQESANLLWMSFVFMLVSKKKIYIYIYIYICVCVCVCVCYLEQLSNVLIEWLLKCKVAQPSWNRNILHWKHLSLHILIITFKLFFKHVSRVIIWHLWYMNSSHCFGVNLFLLSIFSCYMGEKCFHYVGYTTLTYQYEQTAKWWITRLEQELQTCSHALGILDLTCFLFRNWKHTHHKWDSSQCQYK